MTILCDSNQIFIANLFSQLAISPKEEVSEDLVRHMVLNTILNYRRKFGEKYGELILCLDDREYWRKSVFPYYKAGRKKARDASKHDWNLIFKFLDKIKAEIRENLPYAVIGAKGAEADDVISTIVHKINEYPSSDKILIISSDHDFLQLQKFGNVEQYSPNVKRFIRTDNPKKTLVEHIITGCSGDGIPNFLSQDDIFTISGKKQSSVTKVKLEKWLQFDKPEDFCDENMLRNYKRNEQLIDLSLVPDNIRIDIEAKFIDREATIPSRKLLLNYFSQNGLRNLLTFIQQF